MTRLSTKLCAAAAVAALTAVVAWPLVEGLRERELVDHYSSTVTRLAHGPERTQPWPAPADAGLPSVLELERPLHPPSTFQRFPLSGDELEALFPLGSDYIRGDPFAYYVNAPGVSAPFDWPEHPDGKLVWKTNSLGLREDEEVARERPDLRVLVLGDSHTAGLCNNDESYPSLLEARLGAQRPELSIDVLNAGKSGYSFQHYLGTFERLLPLQPDAVVVAIYTGNDFEEGLELYHLFNGSERPAGADMYPEQIDAAKRVSGPCFSQSFQALKYFAAHPEQREVALQMARDQCVELAVTALRHSTPITFVLIPPPTDVEWELHADVLGRLQSALALRDEDLGAIEHMTDSLADFLRAQGLAVVDLRADFKAAGEQLYWHKDNHINLRAQELIADALAPRFEDLLLRAGRRARRDPGTSFDTYWDARDALFSPGAPPREARRRSRLYGGE